MLDNATRHASPAELKAAAHAIRAASCSAGEYLARHNDLRDQARAAIAAYVPVAAGWGRDWIEYLRLAEDAAAKAGQHHHRDLILAVRCLLDDVEPDDLGVTVQNVCDRATEYEDYCRLGLYWTEREVADRD